MNRLLLLLLVSVAVLASGCDDEPIRVAVPGDSDPPSGPAIVRLVPGQPIYQVGDRIVVEIVIEGAQDVGAIAFHLLYDATVIPFSNPATEGPFMGSDGAETVFLASDTQGGGEIVVGASRFGTTLGISGEGTLAVFEFDAVATGEGGFRFSGAAVRDPQARSLPAAFNAASIRVEEAN